MKKHKVFIVDDHPLVREGLSQVFNQEKDFEVCGEAVSAKETMSKLKDQQPDIAIIDLSLKDMSGLELIQNILDKYPGFLILVLSMHDESLYAERVLKAGARGYIMKEEDTEEVVIAARKIIKGQIYLSGHVATEILGKITAGKTTSKTSLDLLSNRELQVFQLIGKGLARRQIAQHLYLSVKTIDAHCTNIKDKLNIKNTTALVRYATLHYNSQMTNEL